MQKSISGPCLNPKDSFIWSISLKSPSPVEVKRRALKKSLKKILKHPSYPGGQTQLWINAVQAEDDHLAAEFGFSAYRDLVQFHCALPLALPQNLPQYPLQTKTFTSGDIQNFLKIQNRSFSWHPEEADMDPADFAQRRQEPWFDPNGLLLYEQNGHLAGFCWTKVHNKPSASPLKKIYRRFLKTHPQEPIGEIYMVGIDPDFQGQKLGEPMTRAGFDYLARQNIKKGMLFVESDNDAAIRVYERLGMQVHAINRAYKNRLPS